MVQKLALLLNDVQDHLNETVLRTSPQFKKEFKSEENEGKTLD